ncbi:MAG: putative repeat protein (TIGR03806 family) [Mariniblastus sp.]|jgi:uncharacterized repeat protein (TIGR03806 family)
MLFKNILPLYSVAIALGICSLSSAQVPGTPGEVKPANESGQHVGIELAYSQLRFDRPIYLTGAGDGSGRVFVAEQGGVVRWFNQNEENPTAKVFLDISDLVSRNGNEEGLLGFAFHPKFKDNGFVYCHYSSDKTRTGENKISSNIISRFKILDDPNLVDINSEKILLTVPQPFANHNGGAMIFGQDGYLYFSLGDGGFRDDPQGNGQNLKTMLGAINRIDVDQESAAQPYSIPADNPFVDTAGAAPELYAIGLRNVWRFSFDRKTGELWAADVGQNLIEEVNLIQRGGNYGWNRFEANDDFTKETQLAIERHDKPIAWYGHEWGGSITGGNVYRGKQFPELDGSYFFGDYMTGNLWRTRKNESGEYLTELIRRTGRSIASFGEDDHGELYLLSFDGRIYRIVPTENPENTFQDWPSKLSETGLFVDMKKQTPADNLVAYEVNAPFWSDNASKQRYFVLPSGESLTYRDQGTWTVPVGATIVKNFAIPNGRNNWARTIETRLIKRTDAGWESATYVWNRQLTEAELLIGGKQFEYRNSQGVQSWHAPSSSECAACHVDAAGYVLGLNTAQLNRESNGSNQITQWAKQGLLKIPADLDLSQAPQFCSPFDQDADLETRARVYLDVNCAMCHQPNGPGNANIDLQFATDLKSTKTIDIQPAQGHFGIDDARIVASGDPERSMLLHRIETKNAGRMPNIGSNIVHEEAADLLRAWIKSLKE